MNTIKEETSQRSCRHCSESVAFIVDERKVSQMKQDVLIKPTSRTVIESPDARIDTEPERNVLINAALFRRSSHTKSRMMCVYSYGKPFRLKSFVKNL